MAVRKRGNSYQVVYRCYGEKTPRTETFKSEDEALIRDMQIKLAKKNGTFKAPEKIEKGKVKVQKDVTIKELLDEYVTVYGLKKWGNSYYSANQSLIKNYINPYLGNRYVRSITIRDIDEYYTMLIEVPSALAYGHRDTGENVSAGTIARIHKLLKSAFGRAVLWEYTKTNPTIGATLPRYVAKERTVWSDSEALEAIRLCDNPTLRICLYLALGCSMRLGEILGLQWNNVHIERNLISSGDAYLKIDREPQRCTNESIEELERVNRSTIILKFPIVMPKKGTTTVVLKAPKTESSNRIVFLPNAVIEELQRVKDMQNENKSLLADEYHDYDLVVAKVNGLPYEIRTVDNMLYKLIEKHSLRPVVFHSLRHSSTSLKLKLSRGNIKAVQGDTGHSEARMVTDTYAHSFDEDRKDIAKEMDAAFFSKVEQHDTETLLTDADIQHLRNLIKQHPEILENTKD